MRKDSCALLMMHTMYILRTEGRGPDRSGVFQNYLANIYIGPVRNLTLQVIGLQILCLEKAIVAVDALQLYLRLKY